MEPRFDVFFTGELVRGADPGQVQEGLARLFRIDVAAAGKLLDGERHRIKGNCDKATALRYREAMLAVGAKVQVARFGGSPEASTPAPDPAPAARADHRAQAEAIARAAGVGATTDLAAGEKARFDAFAPGDKPIEFEPQSNKPGTPTELTLAPLGAIIGEAAPKAPPQIINVPSYDLAEAGAAIPNAPRRVTELDPRTDHLTLEPVDAKDEA